MVRSIGVVSYAHPPSRSPLFIYPSTINPPTPTNNTDPPFQVLRHGRMVFAVTKKGAEQSQIRKEFGHIIPHGMYARTSK